MAKQVDAPPGNAATQVEGTSPLEEAQNGIWPSKAPARTARPSEVSPALPEGKQSAKPAPSRPSRTTRVVPDEVRRKFVQVDNKFFFPDGTAAFTDKGNKVVTQSENTVVIQSMVSIVQARTPGGITVSGTERFRREAWFAARMAGRDVEGYDPTPLDEQRLVRGLAQGSGVPSSSTPTTATDPPASSKPLPRETGRLIVGTLEDHGSAPHPKYPETQSYFVTLKTSAGDRKIFGIGLHRALKESLTRVQLGDEVGLRLVRREPVEVRAPTFDSEGRITGQKKINAQRNAWILEKREFFRERAADARIVRDPNADPKAIAKNRPHLIGTFLQMAAAKIAAKALHHPEDRERFLTQVRHTLADSVRRGEPLPPVRMQEPPAQSPEKPTRPPPGRERDPSPVRG